jgi:ribosomal protein L12E/L44/L45/RPP1/RPP2
MDNFDTDRITATVTEAVGVPPDNMRAQRDVDAIREARAKAAQTKAALDAADQAVRAAATAAGASTGEDKNLLQDLLGGA